MKTKSNIHSLKNARSKYALFGLLIIISISLFIFLFKNSGTIFYQRSSFDSKDNSINHTNSSNIDNEIVLGHYKLKFPQQISLEIKKYKDENWPVNSYCRKSLDQQDDNCDVLKVTNKISQGSLIISHPSQFGFLVSDGKGCFKEVKKTIKLGNENLKMIEYYDGDEIKYNPSAIDSGRNPYDCSDVAVNDKNFHHLNGCSENNLCVYTDKESGINNFYTIIKQVIVSEINKPTINNPIPTKVSLSTPTLSPKKKLTYFLPQGWKTITDQTNTFEVGYDPTKNNPHPLNKAIDIQKNGPLTGEASYISLVPYDGGSRHKFIYKQLNKTNPIEDRLPGYYESEFTYNGWSCLVLYGLGFSASGVNQGMCAISSTEAFFLFSIPDESLIRTIRLIK